MPLTPLLLCAPVALAAPQGVTITQMDKVLPPNASGGFGSSGNGVAFDGDTMIVSQVDELAIQVFERGAAGWQHVQSVTPPDPNVAMFPMCTDVQGDVLVTGARGNAASPWNDRVFVYRRTAGTWTFEQELITGDPAMNGVEYGHSGNNSGFAWRNWERVKVHGDTVVIGCPLLPSDPPQNTLGTCFVFEYAAGQWTLEQRLAPADTVNEVRFGGAVDFDGSRILVGDPLSSRQVPGSWILGRAHVYEEVGGVWTETQVLEPTHPFPTQNNMGQTLAIDGDVLVLSTNEQVSRAEVYEYAGGSWVHRRQLTGPGTYFGCDVEVEGSLVFVGCRSESIQGNPEGRVHIFSDDANQWNEAAVIEAFDSVTNMRFGTNIAVSDRQLIVTAPRNPIGIGSVYGADYCPLIGTPYCSANPNSSGLAAGICAGGSAVRADEEIALFAHFVPQGAFGYFLASEGQDFVANFAGSQGNLCLGGGQTIYRFSLFVQQAPVLGTVRLDVPWGTLPAGASLDAGETWNFQFWYRDANPGVTSNTSDALAITLL